MLMSFRNNKTTALEKIDSIIDGAAVKRVGDLNFAICQQNRTEVITVPEGKRCQIILDLYNKGAILAEPTGALHIASLESFREEIKGKIVVCIVSGSNNNITRTAEIKERAMLYANLKHYFIVKFPQRAVALKEFVAEILGPNDHITYFEYTKKNNRTNGAAVVGLELKSAKD
jgi:threonine dehydratase